MLVCEILERLNDVPIVPKAGDHQLGWCYETLGK